MEVQKSLSRQKFQTKNENLDYDVNSQNTSLCQDFSGSGLQIIMQEQGSFTIVKKEVENLNSTPPAKFQEVTITIQREGSVAVTHRGVIGKNEFAPQLEEILLQMHQGDRWEILSHSKVAYTVEVIEVGKAVDSRNHLERAEALKLEGNGFIKQKQNRKAVEKYTQAYNLVINDPSTKAYELKLSLISNLALVSLNLQEFRAAINWCNQHLEQTLEPNLKIVYRKASANKGLKNWAEARGDIDFGVANSSKDAESLDNFKKLLTQLEKEEKQQQKKEKAVYGKMFG